MLGHANTTSYEEFTKRVLEHFEQRDPKSHFWELIHF